MVVTVVTKEGCLQGSIPHSLAEMHQTTFRKKMCLELQGTYVRMGKAGSLIKSVNSYHIIWCRIPERIICVLKLLSRIRVLQNMAILPISDISLRQEDITTNRRLILISLCTRHRDPRSSTQCSKKHSRILFSNNSAKNCETFFSGHLIYKF